MRTRTLLAGAGIAGLALSIPALAHHEGEIVRRSDIAVSHAWTEEIAAASHSTSVYLTIDNEGPEPDRLIGAAVPFADSVGFQAPVLDAATGVLEVKTLAAIQVNPGQTLTLQPGGVSIQLVGVHAFFEHGEHFDMTLAFERAGTVEVEVEVEEPHGDGDEHKHQQTPGA